MVFLATIIFLSLQCVIGTPQLRLSHTGYEIISFDDQTTDDSLPAVTKLTFQNAPRHNRTGVPNLEKTESTDDETESLALSSEQHKLHYEGQGQRETDAKPASQIRPNTIDASAKGFSGVPSEKTNIYLAVGIPTRFENTARRTKESSNVLASSETSTNGGSKNSLDESREIVSTWTGIPKIDARKKKKVTKTFKQSIANRASDKVSTIIDSDFDTSDSRENTKLEKIQALVDDARRAFDRAGAKSYSEEKREKIDTTPVFPTLGKVPSIQIHHQRSFHLPSKSSSIFSPIYPSGFEAATRNFLKQSLLSINEPTHIHPASIQSDSKNSKTRKYADSEVDLSKKSPGYETKEINNGAKEFAKSQQLDRVSSLTMLKNILNNVKRDVFYSKNPDRFPLAGVPPLAGASLYVSPLSLMLRRPFRPASERTHLELNSMPIVAGHIERNHPNGDLSVLHPQGRPEDIIINSVSDAPKAHMLDNYFDNKYLNFKVNNDRTEKLRSKNDFFRNYFGKIHSLNSQAPIRSLAVNQSAKELSMPGSESPRGGLVIEIVHEVAPDNSEDTVSDANKEEAAKEIHEMQDTLQASSSLSPKSSCKRMKPITPQFYQFLAKLTDIVIDKAQQYEAGVQLHENTAKIIEAGRKNNSENTSIFGLPKY